MGRYVVGVLLIVVVVATAVRAGACGMQQGGTQQEVGKMQRVSKSVDPKDVQSARASLKMGAGRRQGRPTCHSEGTSASVNRWIRPTEASATIL